MVDLREIGKHVWAVVDSKFPLINHCKKQYFVNVKLVFPGSSRDIDSVLFLPVSGAKIQLEIT